MVGLDSSYSPLEIHIYWKVLGEERRDPPIHTEYLRSGGTTTSILIVEGARRCLGTLWGLQTDNAGVQILPDVDVALHDRLESGVVDAAGVLPKKAGLEEHLGAT
ncbi:unnamed protein product [Prorocentrum cordatum]|uniref:Uncharacterized protein n=1 Tax=Prorocentrum cordatum TaxID=2364126 RepID=A0ABN9XK54_9DINO|nr:unnamed protein product [Polarella glacialis]